MHKLALHFERTLQNQSYSLLAEEISRLKIEIQDIQKYLDHIMHIKYWIFLQPILFASDFSLKVQPRKIKKERSWGWERIKASMGTEQRFKLGTLSLLFSFLCVLMFPTHSLPVLGPWGAGLDQSLCFGLSWVLPDLNSPFLSFTLLSRL